MQDKLQFIIFFLNFLIFGTKFKNISLSITG